MAKAKPVARKRRAYEYDHQYGVTLTGKKTAKRARSTKRSAKKR
jgi:hypothetical protein